MAFIVEGHATSSTAATSLTTGAMNATGANYMVAMVSLITSQTPTLSDNVGGNTWTQIGSDTSTANRSRYVFHCLAPNVSSSMTVTATFASVNGSNFAVIALSGRDTVTGESGGPTFSIDGANTTSHNLSSVLASANDDVVAFSTGQPGGTATTFTAGSGWTRRGASNSSFDDQTQINVSAGSVQDKFTTSTSQTWADAIVSVLLGTATAPSVLAPHIAPQWSPGQPLNTSQSQPKTLTLPATPLNKSNAVMAVLQAHHPSHALSINADTSRGTPKTLYSDVASPRVAVLQNQPVRRDVFDTSHGTPFALLLIRAPPTGPPVFPPWYPWLPADTTQGTSLPLRLAQAPFSSPPAPVPALYPGLPATTSQSSATALLSGDFFVPTLNPPQFQVDRIRPVVDTSSTLPKALYADALTPAFNPPQFQVDQVRPVYDTSHGTPAEEIQPPIANPPHFAPLRLWWQPPDCCQATPKVLYGDLYQAAIPAPTLLVDPVRPVADTSRSSPLAALTAQAPFTAEPSWAPYRFWWQPADTSQWVPKGLYADALAAIVPPPSYQVDRIRPVTDTTQSTPLALIGAPVPFANLQQPAPARVWWQPPDTSGATPKPLYADALAPVFDAPQFQVDRVRPVTDTSSAEPKALYADQFTPVFDAPQYQIDPVRPVYDTSRGSAIEEIQAPLVNAPWFAPQRYPWLPADTSQATGKPLYGDLYATFFNPPQFQIDPIRPVTDTSRATPTILIPVQASFIAEPWCPPLRFFWQPADTSQSTAKVAYGDANRAIVPPPQYQVDSIRPVADTSQSTPVAITSAAQPFQVLEQPAPARYWWQPADSSQATPKTLYGDLNRAAVPPPSYQVDPVRPVTDTTRGSPDTLTQAPPTFTPPPRLVELVRSVTDTSQSSPLALTIRPAPPAPSFAPSPYVWLPADTSRGTPALLLLPAPIVNAPQFQVDAVRPVYDTSHGTSLPLLLTVRFPFLAQPWQAPLRFWWQPADTSQAGWPPLFGFQPGSPYILVIESRQIDSLIDHTQTFMVIPSRQIDALIDPVQTFTICQEE